MMSQMIGHPRSQLCGRRRMQALLMQEQVNAERMQFGKEADPSRDHDRFASRLSYEISEATFGNSPLGRTMQVTAWSGCPVSNVYLFYPPTDSPQEALMLDHTTKTAQLLADLKAVVPFEVELIPQLVRRLQAENVTEADREHLVYDLSYAGDEGGIVCHLSRSEEAGVALVVSLTHVRVPRSMPLASDVLAYQKHRVKKLKKQVAPNV